MGMGKVYITLFMPAEKAEDAIWGGIGREENCKISEKVKKDSEKV